MPADLKGAENGQLPSALPRMKLVGFTALAFFTLVAWITVETYFLLKRMES